MKPLLWILMLGAARIQTLRDWIDEGALDN